LGVSAAGTVTLYASWHKFSVQFGSSSYLEVFSFCSTLPTLHPGCSSTLAEHHIRRYTHVDKKWQQYVKKKRNKIRSVGLGPATSIHPTMCNSTSKIGYSVLIHIVGMDTSKLGHVGKRCIGSFSSSTGERVTQQMSSCWKGLFSLPFSKDTYLFPEKYHDVC
jgi:hypothetical protein